MVQHEPQDVGHVSEVGSFDRIPQHVAIIMDGNRRWAESRGLPVFEGHRQGVEAVRSAVDTAGELGIKVLTIYSFSTENWSRPDSEIHHLMNLLRLFIRSDLGKLHKANVQIRIIGDRERIDSDILQLFRDAEAKTSLNTGLTLVVAFNYGSRQELVRAMQKIAEKVQKADLEPCNISVAAIDAELDTAGLPDPDLVIRTSGEQRLSNFLLWQLAYAELIFLPILWPEFNRAVFQEALNEFNQRERRYGGNKIFAKA